MKKRIMVVLAAASVLMTGQALAASDLNGHFARQAVQDLEEKGVFQAQAEEAFRPDESVDRAEFKQWVQKALGSAVQDTNESRTTVSRVEAARWVSDAVPVLVKQPNPKLMAINPYDDLQQIDEEQRPAVLKLYGLGIMRGDGMRHFYPSQALTRGEAAVLLDKAMSFMKP